MDNIIAIRINVKAIDKQRLFNGEKGVYLDCTLIPTPNSDFSDYMVVENISKEERQAGKKGTILGNAKIIEKKVPENVPAVQQNVQVYTPEVIQNDDLPF